MDRETWLALLRQYRAIAVLRAPDRGRGVAMAKAAAAGGFRLLEVTWNSDRPADLVTELRQILGAHCWIGAGTILDVLTAKEAIAAGAQFCFSPHLDTALLDLCQTHQIPVIPGALTPTEIMAAWRLGASSVKVFPCEAVGGAVYIRHLQGPLSHIPLVPTGGIRIETASAYLAAGAIAVGMSSSVFPKALIASQDWEGIRRRSQQFLTTLPEAASDYTKSDS